MKRSVGVLERWEVWKQANKKRNIQFTNRVLSYDFCLFVCLACLSCLLIKRCGSSAKLSRSPYRSSFFLSSSFCFPNASRSISFLPSLFLFVLGALAAYGFFSLRVNPFHRLSPKSFLISSAALLIQLIYTPPLPPFPHNAIAHYKELTLSLITLFVLLCFPFPVVVVERFVGEAFPFVFIFFSYYLRK